MESTLTLENELASIKEYAKKLKYELESREDNEWLKFYLGT